ncbi:hypothetical protein ETB97_007276 [Aspergillus alliaceus]|uniref:Prolyl 4-hydroxylase alpha subunit domain-containing protein n=1 Tax=Petromyces alliaceus TaxID=209559 RepID=A0A8H6E235_PETAA|nr:hypothetical protein ETB97_007276 [Aspergillus burnettii]
MTGGQVDHGHSAHAPPALPTPSAHSGRLDDKSSTPIIAHQHLLLLHVYIMLKLSTVLSSLFYLLPIYIFLIAPALRQLFPPSNQDLAFDLDDDDAAAADLEGPILNGSILSLDDGVEVTCPPDTYRVHLLRRDPLVIYIEDFLSDSEADHLVKLRKTQSQNSYTPSMIYDGTAEKIDPTTRLSDRALLPRDTTVRCLENRAKAFQGWRPHLYIERMWAQRYNASGHYRHHYDWAGSSARGGDRASTFMVYLGDECGVEYLELVSAA